MKRIILTAALGLLAPLLALAAAPPAQAADGAETVTDQGFSVSAATSESILVSGRVVASKCKTWWATERGVSWLEKSVGKFCYTGKHVWVWKKTGYAGQGYHYCDKGWGIGYSIDVTTCSTERQDGYDGPGGYFIRNHDYYKVSAIVSGFPIWKSHHYWVNVFPSGTVTFHS